MKKILSSEKVFEGRLLNLYLERRRFPSGYVGNLEVIRHPGAVLAVPFLDDDTIVLIKQYRPVIGAYIWELPAGTLGRNEPPLACAKRELVEEIGYEAARWKRIGYIYPAPGYTTEKIFLFEARGLKKVQHKKEEDEIIEPRAMSRPAIKRLLHSGRIVDAKTIAALAMAGILSG